MTSQLLLTCSLSFYMLDITLYQPYFLDIFLLDPCLECLMAEESFETGVPVFQYHILDVNHQQVVNFQDLNG